MRIGLISNPRSHANRGGRGLAGQPPSAPGLVSAAPRDHAELGEALGRFAGDGVQVLAIDGGDGTVREVLNQIDRAWPEAWPGFALLPSGKTNAIAADLGHFGPGARGLARLLAARNAGKLGEHWTERPALEVSWPGHCVRGFLFGAAAFSEGVRLANERLHPAGLYKGVAVLAALGGVLRRSLARRGPSGAAPGERAELRVDGRRVNGERHFLVLASTLERLTPGLRPFRDRGEGPVNWLDVSAPPVRPIAGLALAALGRHLPWMERNGYASGRARLVQLELDEPFVIDGESYRAEGPLGISGTRPARFLRP